MDLLKKGQEMKNLKTLIVMGLAMFGLVVFTPGIILAQECDGSGKNFVDLDGDGFNDNAPDADGDGIPNGLDEDYVKPEDGDGLKKGKLGETDPSKAQTKTQKFNRMKTASGNTYQKRIGTATQAGNLEPQEGQMGPGDCDGTGPKGNQNKGGK